MNTSGIRMVCFDVGGVLVRHCRTWREGCVAAGLPLREGCEDAEMSRRRAEVSRLMMCGKIGTEEFLKRVSEATGGAYTPEEVARLHHAWLGPEYEGVGPVIRRLVEAGKVETGVLSNTNELHWARLEARNGAAAEFPTTSLLRHRHASHVLGMLKPSGEIFVEFERLTGFAGREILFLDDLPENAAAAAERGWRVEIIDHTRETAGQIEEVLERYGVV